MTDATKLEVTIKGDVERLSLKENDLVVVSFNGSPSKANTQAVTSELSKLLNIDESRVIIACNGVKISVVGENDVTERPIELILIDDASDPSACYGNVIDECETIRPKKINRVRVTDPFEVGIQVGETIVGFRGRNGVYVAIQAGLISYSFPSSRS